MNVMLDTDNNDKKLTVIHGKVQTKHAVICLYKHGAAD